MPPTIVTPPAEEPVSLAEARAQCRASEADDAFLTLAIRGARAKCEGILQRALVSRTVRQTADAFDDAGLRFDLEPVSQVTAVSYVAADGSTVNLASSAWQLATGGPYPLLLPAWGTTWPKARESADAVTFEYVTGYGNAAAVPADIRNWLLLTIGYLYVQREAFDTTGRMSEIPGRFYDGLLDPYRRYGF